MSFKYNSLDGRIREGAIATVNCIVAARDNPLEDDDYFFVKDIIDDEGLDAFLILGHLDERSRSSDHVGWFTRELVDVVPVCIENWYFCRCPHHVFIRTLYDGLELALGGERRMAPMTDEFRLPPNLDEFPFRGPFGLDIQRSDLDYARFAQFWGLYRRLRRSSPARLRLAVEVMNLTK